MLFTFALLAFSIVPSGAILDNAAVSLIWCEVGWWLPELSALFFAMTIVLGIVSRLGEIGRVSQRLVVSERSVLSERKLSPLPSSTA